MSAPILRRPNQVSNQDRERSPVGQQEFDQARHQFMVRRIATLNTEVNELGNQVVQLKVAQSINDRLRLNTTFRDQIARCSALFVTKNPEIAFTVDVVPTRPKGHNVVLQVISDTVASSPKDENEIVELNLKSFEGETEMMPEFASITIVKDNATILDVIDLFNNLIFVSFTERSTFSPQRRSQREEDVELGGPSTDAKKNQNNDGNNNDDDDDDDVVKPDQICSPQKPPLM